VELISAAQKTAAIAYTYSEPLVHIEFLLDCMKEARKAGIANVLVSNGCVNSEAASEILDLCDAANIDLKCFSEETYATVLGAGQSDRGGLAAVTGFIRMAAGKGVHLELTTLIVPGLNDSEAELDKCRDFIAELQTEERVIPWHLSAYHPDYKWHTPATDPNFLLAAANRMREKLDYVYTGNIAHFNDTACPHCGKTIVSRNGYRIGTPELQLKEENGDRSYFCAACGKTVPVRW
jgi:pyruvate formate lyase activating enzyme